MRANDIPRMLRHLAEIPSLYAKLDATERLAGPAGVRIPPGSKPPLRLDVITLTDCRRKNLDDWDADLVKVAGWRTGVLPTVGQWVRLADAEMHDADFEHRDPDEEPTVDTECQWLRDHHQWLVLQDWADEMADEIRRIHHDLRTALGIRPEYHPKCRDCGWRLDPMDDATWYSCSGCGRDYTLDADLKALGQIQTATARDCAIALGISYDRIRQWISRGYLIHDSRDGKGRKLYDLTVVRRVADAKEREAV